MKINFYVARDGEVHTKVLIPKYPGLEDFTEAAKWLMDSNQPLSRTTVYGTLRYLYEEGLPRTELINENIDFTARKKVLELFPEFKNRGNK